MSGARMWQVGHIDRRASKGLDEDQGRDDQPIMHGGGVGAPRNHKKRCPWCPQREKVRQPSALSVGDPLGGTGPAGGPARVYAVP